MSTIDEKIKAQRFAFNSPLQPWHRHLIGPDELRGLLHDRRLLQGALLLLKEAGIEVGSGDLINAAVLAEDDHGNTPISPEPAGHPDNGSRA